jgi:hypothetical protein
MWVNQLKMQISKCKIKEYGVTQSRKGGETQRGPDDKPLMNANEREGKNA